MKLLNEEIVNIISNIIALDKKFEDYELIHTFQGNKDIYLNATKKDNSNSYLSLKNYLKTSNIINNISNAREDYIKRLILSVCAQYEVFHLNINSNLLNDVSNILSCPILPKFDLDLEYESIKKHLMSHGYKTVKNYRSAAQNISFKNFKDLKNYILDLYQRTITILLNKYEHLWEYKLKNIFEKSVINIEESQIDNLPCYYFYEGNYKGTVGITFQESYSLYFLNNFLFHEVIPGHHFYYIVKQYYYDNGDKDECYGLDLYYSPENIINEGLAVRNYKLLEGSIDQEILLANELEQFMHKALYNIWLKKHKFQDFEYGTELKIIKDLFGYSDLEIQTKIDYYTEQEKYYTPCYPIGSKIVEDLFEINGLKIWPLLYEQHSVFGLKNYFPNQNYIN